jgi:intein/homing endonuclease
MLGVGQPVLAEDPTTGLVAPEAVQAVLADPVSPLLAVDLSDGSAITATADHPFWVDTGALFAGHNWLAAGDLLAGDLLAGDQLRTAGGRDVAVVGVRRGVGHAPVYTLTVAKDHTFFVGNARVLVHNSNCFETIAKRIASGHAWSKHAQQFPEIHNANAFAQFIRDILEHPM